MTSGRAKWVTMPFPSELPRAALIALALVRFLANARAMITRHRHDQRVPIHGKFYPIGATARGAGDLLFRYFRSKSLIRALQHAAVLLEEIRGQRSRRKIGGY
jgi:hypothetical protein